MERAAVSAVVPCFRAAATLERALASIAAQTRLPEETLLIDDGNDRDEARRMEETAARFPAARARVVRLAQNRGVASSRNAGWAAARAPLVAFLDADDAWLPRKLELQGAAMAAVPDAALCGTPYQVLSADEPLPREARGTARTTRVGGSGLLVINPLAAQTWMVRREEPNRFAEGMRYVEDHLLLMELALRGRVLVRLDLALTALFKPSLSTSGLSSHLWRMEQGELDAYARLRAQGLIGRAAWGALSALSLVKFVRRVAVVRLLR